MMLLTCRIVTHLLCRGGEAKKDSGANIFLSPRDFICFDGAYLSRVIHHAALESGPAAAATDFSAKQTDYETYLLTDDYRARCQETSD